ncbi:Peptidoglycan-binding domain 1 protein [metagenome]|uniref:Peptidoglycan-binding domain 1 protein n=1 Tax=metagenome TaxID=256318 RepID=A0A2P2BZP6_9ZZZZ
MPPAYPVPCPALIRASTGENMPSPARRPARRLTAPLVALTIALLVVSGWVAPATAREGNVATPGNFTGYGFDQCLAPEQSTMDRWLNRSPFLAVGIYVSGDSRGCRSQPNLTPTWVSTQLSKGWRLLPITLGPQASCSTHFPRYGSDETIDPYPGAEGKYGRAKAQAIEQAEESVSDAAALGIAQGSALWYDLEGFDDTRTACRESALRFLSAWTGRVRKLGYLAGVYSSAGSGIEMLDRARAAGESYRYPDYIWIARWDGVANTRTSYISDEGWNPHRRIKQYQGGHNETWGGVTINIDRNWLDLGKGSVGPPNLSLCGGLKLNFFVYQALGPEVRRPYKTAALQCLLSEKGLYDGKFTGTYDAATSAAANLWQARVGATVSSTWSTSNWSTLLSAGSAPVVKIGSANRAVRRLQRALNAELPTARLHTTGLFDAATVSALRTWQQRSDLPVSGVAAANTWARLQS